MDSYESKHLGGYAMPLKIASTVMSHFLKEPFGDVDTIPVSVAPDAELARGGIHLCCELQLRDLQFEFSGECGSTQMGRPIGKSASFAMENWESRYRH